MSDIRLITKKRVTLGKFRCNTCGMETDVYFIDDEAMTSIQCQCSGTSILFEKPVVVVEATPSKKEKPV